MENTIKTIQNCSLLKFLPPEVVQTYYNEGHILIKSYGKNETLHFEGDLCHNLEIIMKGQIEVERIDDSGRVLTVAAFNVGDNLGANLLFSQTIYYPMSVTSKTYSEVIVLNKEFVFELCKIYPEFLLRFIQIISDHTVILGAKIKNHVSRTIRESIISYINQEYLLQSSLTIKLTMSKKALAENMGISRTSLSRELQKMKTDHLIDYSSTSITISDQNILQ
jgi:CRP-like cAMP-binding protein